MANVIGIDNAIGWAHWQLRGWKTTLLTTVAYGIGIVGLIYLGTHAGDPPPAQRPVPEHFVTEWTG